MTPKPAVRQPEMPRFKATCRYTRKGEIHVYDFDYPYTQLAADSAMWDHLRKIGWKPVRWWQWWRWGDYPRRWPK